MQRTQARVLERNLELAAPELVQETQEQEQPLVEVLVTHVEELVLLEELETAPMVVEVVVVMHVQRPQALPRV